MPMGTSTVRCSGEMSVCRGLKARGLAGIVADGAITGCE